MLFRATVFTLHIVHDQKNLNHDWKIVGRIWKRKIFRANKESGLYGEQKLGGNLDSSQEVMTETIRSFHCESRGEEDVLEKDWKKTSLKIYVRNWKGRSENRRGRPRFFKDCDIYSREAGMLKTCKICLYLGCWKFKDWNIKA